MVIMGSNSMVNKVAIALVAFIVVVALLSIGRYTNYFSSQDPGLESTADRIVNEFDFFRIIKQKTLSSNDYIDLVLSGDDLNHISNSMESFTADHYIRDQLNPWRKAKVVVNGNKEKVKFKFHGTDISSMYARTPMLERIKRKLGFNISKLSPINAGTFSIKIKHKKKSNYYNLMRRYNLLNPYDNHEISTIIINKIASNLGLISPYGRTVILRINGSEIGPYMLVEANNKGWFEREHQITSYTIFRSNDDWDRKESIYASHVSDTDLYMGNKNIKTISKNSSVAAGALDLLLKYIRSGDVEQIKKMLDIDYMAKYMALLTITNDNHPITGDNLKYIYNHATGRFKLLFRQEVTARRNINAVSKFNQSLFMRDGGDKPQTLKLFKLLLTDVGFLTKRDIELNKIVQKDGQWLSLINKVVAENMRVFQASSMPNRRVEYKVDKFRKNFANNIRRAKLYLDYNKIFITKYTDLNGKKSLRIINDFVHPITLNITNSIDNKNESKTRSTKIFINPSRLDINQKIIYKEQKIDINIDDISKLSFVDMITGRKILQRHIYFNEVLEHPVFSKESSLQTLKDNHINYEINHKEQRIKIQSGQYKIGKNIVTPYGFNVTIQKNTKLLFNKGVSFLVRGGLDIKGTMKQPVIIDRNKKDAPFGVFAVKGEKIENTKVNINHLKFNGGSESIVNGTLFTGQMSIINADVSIKNSTFENSMSDDGINIKFSKVDISNSMFVNNFGDQIDLDYCQATVSNSVFSSDKVRKQEETDGTDGLDVSGSTIRAFGNTFSNLSDKGISVGEISNILIANNIFNNNNLAIAVKDGSQAFVDKNNFDNNTVDITMYIKKKIYSKPTLYTLPINKVLNLKAKGNTVFYSDNLNQKFSRSGLNE